MGKQGETGVEKLVDPIVEHFAAIIARIEAGESVRSICDKPGMPTRNEFRRALRDDPALMARYLAAKALFYRTPVRRGRARVTVTGERLDVAEQILDRVRAGMSLRAACAAEPRIASLYQMHSNLRLDPGLKRRYLAASKHQHAPPQPVPAGAVDEVIADVAGGSLLRDACAARGIKTTAFQFRVLDDPAQRPQWFAAKSKGQEIRLSRGSLRHAAEIIGIIESGRTLKDTLASDPRYPHPATFRAALDTNAALRARYDAAIARQTLDRFVATRRPRLFVPAPAVIKSRTMLPPGERLATSLTSDELWRAAVAALPKHLDPDMRNDVAGDIVVAVLSGDLSPHQIASEAKRFIRAHNKKFSQFEFASLDKSVAFDSTLSIIETLSSDAWE
jgi:hypothetical protein